MPIAVGIDLGTTNSVAAVATATGVRLAVGDDGLPIHPSIVAFPEWGGVVVGQAAKPRRAIDPENTIYSAKRLIGQNVRAPLVQLALTALPYRVEEGQNQQPIIVVRGRRMTVPEVSALVLGQLKKLAERQFGDEINEAVITVPANFTDAQRQATKEAGLIAGLEVLRLVNEPTAAALAYGYGRRLDEVVAVFDYGGGTFDLSLLKIRSEIFEVLATDGDFFLGGDDIDRAIAEYLAADMNRVHGLDPRPHPEAMTRLTMAAEEIKCFLSTEDEASGEIDGLVIADRHESLRLPFQITRARYDAMIRGYVDKTIDVCRQVLLAAKLEPKQVSDVILVGGSTRIPLIRQRVAELFGKEPRAKINPDEVVAHGAAIQAAMLTGAFVELPADSVAVAADMPSISLGDLPELPALGAPSPAAGPRAATQLGVAPFPSTGAVPIVPKPAQALLLDVTPSALAIATVRGFAEMLLEKNAPIPIEHTKIFTTARDQQTRVVIDCCRGEARRYDENEPLGSLVLDEIPAGPKGQAKIEVTFRVDSDGILNVRACDVATGKKQEARLDVLGAPTAPPPGTDRPKAAR